MICYPMNELDGSKFDINPYERWVYSQNGEDSIIAHIFSRIGTTNKFFVELVTVLNATAGIFWRKGDGMT